VLSSASHAGVTGGLLRTNTDKPSGDWSIFVRDDGKKRWAYKGRPLYAWKNDKAPDDTDGDGKLNGAWHIAAPWAEDGLARVTSTSNEIGW
jgi:predicted lipoprotein with Yx(FWY)xxD motif